MATYGEALRGAVTLGMSDNDLVTFEKVMKEDVLKVDGPVRKFLADLQKLDLPSSDKKELLTVMVQPLAEGETVEDRLVSLEKTKSDLIAEDRKAFPKSTQLEAPRIAGTSSQVPMAAGPSLVEQKKPAVQCSV